MGAIFKIPGMIIYFLGGLWGLFVCLDIVAELVGIFGTIIALLILPVTLYIAPWYAGLALDNWFPVLLVYGTTIVAWVLVAIGSMLDGD